MDMLSYFLGRLAEGSTGGTGGISYKSITYNNDDTITLIDTDDTEHTMACTYDAAGVLVGLTYDGEAVELSYEGDNLVGVGGTTIDLTNTTIRHEFEISVAGDNVSSSMGTKTNNGVAIYGLGYDKGNLGGTFYSGYLISKNEKSVFTSNITTASTLTYNDEVWYYGIYRTNNDKATYQDGVIVPYDVGNLYGATAVTEILNYYFNVDATAKIDIQNGLTIGLTSGGVVQVKDTTEIDNLETLIDESGVLEDTEGTVNEKVEQLIDKAEELDVFMTITNAKSLFQGVKSFPTKAVVNLPNATTIQGAFWNWAGNSMPKVEEIIVNAPNVSNDVIGNTQSIFSSNGCVNKVVLNISNETKYLSKCFTNFGGTEIVLGFSTKNVIEYEYLFRHCFSLEKIIGVFDFSSAGSVGEMFTNCRNLKEVRFEPNTLSISISLANSSLLTNESIQSIIDGLATVTTAQTITFHSAIALSDEQKATINAKGWTLAQ